MPKCYRDCRCMLGVFMIETKVLTKRLYNYNLFVFLINISSKSIIFVVVIFILMKYEKNHNIIVDCFNNWYIDECTEKVPLYN
jgi:hypothetical protein